MTKKLLDKSDVRKQWRGYPDTKSALLEGLELGWTLEVVGGGKPKFRCPCGGPWVKVSWTPQNDGRHAQRLRANFRKKCPDQHALMK